MKTILKLRKAVKWWEVTAFCRKMRARICWPILECWAKIRFPIGTVVTISHVPADDRIGLKNGEEGIVRGVTVGGWVWVEFKRLGETQRMMPKELKKQDMGL